MNKLKAKATISEIMKTFDKKQKSEMEQESIRETYNRLTGCATNAAKIPVIPTAKKQWKSCAASKSINVNDPPPPGRWPGINADLVQAAKHISVSYPVRQSGDAGGGDKKRSRLFQERIKTAL